MYRAALAALAAVYLLPSVVVAQLTEDSEREGLEQEFNSLAYGGSPRAYHHHGHQHARHHRPHRQHKKAFLFARGPATTIPAAASAKADGLLPGRHPTVQRKLGHMEQQIRDLAGRQKAAKMARGDLEENVQKAVLHMNEAVGIKRELARTKFQLRSEEIKLKKLEDDRLRLDRTHGHLVSSLHHIMEPKIEFAETRLKQSEKRLHNLETKEAEWKEKEDKFHESSLAMLEERKATKARLEASQDALQKAKLEHDTAKKQLESVKHKVAFNIEGYRYTQTRARATASEEERAKEVERESKLSVKRLNGILNMEQKRVDESMAIGKDRVQGKIRELEGVEERSKVKASRLSEDYRAWQRRQQDWAARVAATKQVTNEASQDFATQQQAVLSAANAKVAYDAESDSDWAWDEWPGTKQDTDEVRVSDM